MVIKIPGLYFIRLTTLKNLLAMRTRKNKNAYKKKNAKLGLPPGALIFTGEQKLSDVQITLFRYDAENCIKEDRIDVDTILDTKGMTWLDVRGVHDSSVIEAIGKKFENHPLVLEDIMDVSQRPKFEEYENEYYLTLRNFKFDEERLALIPEQISIYADANWCFHFKRTLTICFRML